MIWRPWATAWGRSAGLVAAVGIGFNVTGRRQRHERRFDHLAQVIAEIGVPGVTAAAIGNADVDPLVRNRVREHVGQRIDDLAVDVQLVVQVRARGEARASHGCDALPAGHSLPLSYVDA